MKFYPKLKFDGISKDTSAGTVHRFVCLHSASCFYDLDGFLLFVSCSDTDERSFLCKTFSVVSHRPYFFKAGLENKGHI